MKFYKYQGTGNDFILVDNRNGAINLNTQTVAKMCDRKFGIGADGLMLLEIQHGYDFRMVYYNADGNESTMCGNGGRCITAFAKRLGLITDKAHFIAIDGAHNATIDEELIIHLQMNNVSAIHFKEDHSVLNTGSPHYVKWVSNVDEVDVYKEGKKIRYANEFAPGGTNVNFVQLIDNSHLKVRTYERGVENETLSCGTGVTAAAIAATQQKTGQFTTKIETPGGYLKVSFLKPTPGSAHQVILSGPAEFVFEGTIEL